MTGGAVPSDSRTKSPRSVFALQSIAILLSGRAKRSVAVRALSSLLAGLIAVGSMAGPTGAGAPLASSSAYPCAGSNCGCIDAGHCWRACCCLSLDQRLAWARRHGVAPPSGAMPARGAISSPVAARDLEKGHKPRKCCASGVARVTPPARRCCGAARRQSATGKPVDVRSATVVPASNSGVRLAALEGLNRCRNGALLVVLIERAIAPTSAPFSLIAYDACGWIAPSPNRYTAIVLSPDPRPPR